jgi:protein SCO1/2
VGDWSFTATNGRRIRLAELRGTPLALNFIYTACADVCPTLVVTLADAADAAWGSLGKGSFKLLTVGFNAPADSPGAMRAFASQRGLKGRDWLFLAGDPVTVAGLAQDTGFVFYDSAKGFDHLAQVTLIDRDGVVRAQVYGDTFDAGNFIEPMKAILAGSAVTSPPSLWDKVRLYCTVYDARAGKYAVNYSFFLEIFAGITFLLPVGWFVARSWRFSGRHGRRSPDPRSSQP